MKKDTVNDKLPPVIRVFLSSTFADMERERTYFNEHLSPQLSRLCAERGVSFFSVDLRWGITEEEQVNGKVLPICLCEIDRCRPFFIGILGNRYGSLMEEIPLQIGDSIPWLEGKEGKSVTELEMLYATLEHEQDRDAKNAAFFLRSDSLSEQWYGKNVVSEKLNELKKRIREDEQVDSAEYHNLEEFGASVLQTFQEWLDREFPLSENVEEIRREWYNGELLRNYIPVSQMHSFLNAYFQESSRPLLLYGDGARGKTTFLTSWKPEEGHKILINCGSDDAFLYWPTIAQNIINQLNVIDPDCGYPDIDTKASMGFWLLDMLGNTHTEKQPQRLHTNLFMVTDEDRENFRKKFVQWLSGLKFSQPVYIVINDLNLLEDSSSQFLSWLPVNMHDSVHLVCSANKENMIRNAEILGWNCKEMPTFPEESVREFVLQYLRIYGKGMSASQLDTLVQSPVTVYPGQLRFLVDFLIEYGRFHNLDMLIEDLAAQKDPQAMYQYIMEHISASFSERERRSVRVVFGLLRHAQMSLSEQECYRLTGEFTGITAMEWANIRSIFEHFNLIKCDYWSLREEELQKFTDRLLHPEEHAAIHTALGNYMYEQLTVQNENSERLQDIREKTAFAKSALLHFRLAGNMPRLLEALMSYHVWYYLIKLDWQVARASWMALFLDSDIDIPDKLFGLLEKYRGNTEDERLIRFRIEQLFSDMSFRNCQERLKEILGETYTTGSFLPDFSDSDKAFVELYNQMCDLKEQAEFRKLYDLVNHCLSSNSRYKPIEMCSLYFFKGDSEGHLNLYEELLQTANQYYKMALQASSMYDLRRAVSMRGDAYFRLRKNQEALQCQDQVSALALQEGDVRAYLAACNTIAMCQYRMNRFAESIRTFDMLYGYWKKLGDVPEAANVRMNKCNAIFLSGDPRRALEESEALYQDLPVNGSVWLRRIRASILGNSGYYAAQIQDYPKAEKLLKQAIRDAESNGQETTCFNSMNALINVYKETDQIMLTAEASEKLMNFLWEKRQYKSLLDILNSTMNLLSANFYPVMAAEMKSRWEEKFSQLQGGKEFLLQSLKSVVADEATIDSLHEQLAIARSESDLLKTAGISTALAAALLPGERREGIRYLLNASDLYKKAGKPVKSSDCLSEAAIWLFKKGVVADPQLYKEAVEKIEDQSMLQIVTLWNRIGKCVVPQEDEKQSFISRLMKKNTCQCDEDSALELLLTVSSYGKEHKRLVLSCLSDFVEIITGSGSVGQMIGMIRNLPEKAAQEFLLQIRNRMVNDCEQDFAGLVKDYESAAATQKLEYYEKFMQIMQIPEAESIDTDDIAAIAGNLATIYRRRGDQEKTLGYHTRALDIYKKNNRLRDYFIEMLNMATAYDQFGQFDQAVALLRKGIPEARQAGEDRLEASMSGNLAAYLSKLRDPSLDTEIIGCYHTEEQYFRSSRLYRDLAISLFHQVIFYSERQTVSPDIWKGKLKELEEIAAKHRFPDIAKAVAGLKRSLHIAENRAENGALKDAEAVKARIQELVAAEPPYRMEEFTEEQPGLYHAFCLPVKESKIELANLHLFLNLSSSYQLKVVLLCQPRLSHEETDVKAEEFTAWWNEQKIYALTWHKEKKVLQATMYVNSPDWNEIVSGFGKLMKLWEADKACLQMISIGLGDLSMLQEMKRKTLSEVGCAGSPVAGFCSRDGYK